MSHFNYVCFFSNNTFKVGITKEPTRRLAEYVRSATRFGREIRGFWVSCPRTEDRARLLETAVKRVYADCAVTGHAETFDGSVARGHVVVKSLGCSQTERPARRLPMRAYCARFGKAQASTGWQRAVVVATIARNRGVQL